MNRLKNYDYSWSGFYFITICTKNRECHFGDIVNLSMKKNKYGKIVEKQWLWLGEQYPYINLAEYIVMPNHFHGIIEINNLGIRNVGTGRDLSLQPPVKIKSLSEIIGAFKTTSSKLIHQMGFYDFAWQRSFHDHIIRNEKLLQKIREYIINNPAKWDEDRNNPLLIKK